ncbi:Uncharacterized protein SCF082_LOCUS50377 [Durusdinium trenchii]|uniref:Response regulatory domain-containing protein n=1 Tax=Durusdinium trenchii TaxID=1381693 RepID=A0ABP0S7I2_9DINO
MENWEDVIDHRRILVDENLPEGVFGARLCVFVCSMFLLAFYAFQTFHGKCNKHPIYVQSVTAITYGLASFGKVDFLFTNFQDSEGNVIELALGRYLFWIMTCPVIISNLCILVNTLTPSDLDFGDTTFVMVKDIVLMNFGILGAFQTDTFLKATFITLAFLTSFWMLFDLWNEMMAKKKYFVPHKGAWAWIKLVAALFVSTWAIFPVLYVLGPPMLNIISPAADHIGHAIGDLFAKNFSGFVSWYVRWIYLAPFADQARDKRAISPYHSSTAEIMLGSVGSKRRKKPLLGATYLRVLVVEPKVEMQRLFFLLLKEANVDVEFAFNLAGAEKQLKRERLGVFDVCMVNLGRQVGHEVAMQKFRAKFRSKPYYLPILGYTLDGDMLLSLLENEEREKLLCDGLIHHILDEWHIAELVQHWTNTAKHWKDIDLTADIERRLYDHVQGNLTPCDVRQALETNDEDTEEPQDHQGWTEQYQDSVDGMAQTRDDHSLLEDASSAPSQDHRSVQSSLNIPGQTFEEAEHHRMQVHRSHEAVPRQIKRSPPQSHPSSSHFQEAQPGQQDNFRRPAPVQTFPTTSDRVYRRADSFAELKEYEQSGPPADPLLRRSSSTSSRRSSLSLIQGAEVKMI